MNRKPRNHPARVSRPKRTGGTARLLLALALTSGSPTRAGAAEIGGAVSGDEALMFAQIPTVYAAARREQTITQAPAAVSVISRDDIRKYHYRTLGQALASVPGLYLTNDRGYEQIGARGLGIPNDYNVRVLFLLNGMPLNDKYYGTFITEMGPDMLDAIERIEVVKGPASTLFGSNALFATVNIITRKGADLDGHPVVSAEGGLDAFGRGVFTCGQRWKNGLDLFATGHFEANEGERRIPFGGAGTARGADDQHLADAYLSARYGDFFFQTWYADRQKELPTGQFSTLVGDERNETRDRWYMSELRWQKALDPDKSLMVRGYYEDSLYGATYAYDDPDSTLNHERTRDRWAGFEAQFGWQPVEEHNITFGSVYEYHWTQLRGHYHNAMGLVSSVYPGADESFAYTALYVQDEWRIIKPLTLTAGLRYDFYPDENLTHFSPRAALVWAATRQTTAKLIYGEAFRAPSEYQRTYPAGSATGPPDPNLAPETISTYELVVEHDFRHGLFGRLSLFYNDINDLIAPRAESAVDTIFANLLNVNTVGAEAEVTKRFDNGVRGFLSGTWQESYADHHQRLINSPEWIGNFGLIVPIVGDKLAVSLRENFVSARQTRMEGLKTDSALLTDLTLSSENALPDWSFFFSVFNLLDEQSRVPSGRSGAPGVDRIPQRGRLFVLRASYRF